MNKTGSRVSAAVKLAENAPAKNIVQTINALLDILRKRGIAIVDFEDQTRKIHGFKIFTNTAYLLATRPMEGNKDGNKHER